MIKVFNKKDYITTYNKLDITKDFEKVCDEILKDYKDYNFGTPHFTIDNLKLWKIRQLGYELVSF